MSNYLKPLKINTYLLKTVGLVGFMIIATMGVILLQRPQIEKTRVLSPETYRRQEELERIRLNLLQKVPDLGFGNLIANWAYLQFIQYYGDGDARKITGSSLSPDYLETVVQYDPRFINAYLVMSSPSSIAAGRPDRTVKIMESGLKELSPQIPEAEYVWIYKGVDELLFLGDNEAAQQSYQKASEWAEEAGNTRIAESTQRTANFIANNPDSKQARLSAWFMVFAAATDEETRDFARSHIEALGGKLQISEDGRVTMITPEDD